MKQTIIHKLRLLFTAFPIERAAILLLLAGSFFSCAKRSESGGEVPYAPCPCENNEKPLATIKGEARLYFDDVFWTPPFDSERIVFFSETNEYPDHVKLALDDPRFRNPMGGVVFVDICNFPDFAKEWNSPGGITVYYEGIIYPWCDILGVLCRGTPCYSSILTKLIKIEKP